MSTRRKEGTTPPGKEKRGTSPSSSSNVGSGRRSPGPSPKTNDSSSPSAKSIPSYLKPTAASDASKLQPAAKKKPSSVTPEFKATIERRRSFDNKPPSPSRSTKSPVSPNPTLRSSSFSGKINNDPAGSAIKPGLARRRSFDKPPSPSRITRSPISPIPTSSSGKTSASHVSKGVSERNSKGPKDATGKQHTLYARPATSVKKSSSVVTKKSEPSSRKKRVESSPEKVRSPEVQEREPQSDEHESFAVEEEEAEYSLLEDQDVNNIIDQIEGESHDNDAVIESPTVVKQHVESPAAAENQEDKIVNVEHCTDTEHEDDEDDKSRDEEMSKEQDQEIEEETTAEQDQEIKEETTANEVNHADESGAEGPNEEVEDKEIKEDKNEEAIQVDNGGESNDDQLEEKHVQEVVVVEEKKQEEEEEEGATPRVAHGKKDVALSNDVIEETRNKLIEQRRNKVKALAGAFETVISLQDK